MVMFDKCLAKKTCFAKRKQKKERKIKFRYLLRALHMLLWDKGRRIQIFSLV